MQLVARPVSQRAVIHAYQMPRNRDIFLTIATHLYEFRFYINP